MAIARVQDELRARIGAWLSPLRRPGALPAGFALDDYETEQGVTLSIAGPEGALTVELEGADPSRPCFARTARFNVYYNVVRGGRGALSSDERRVLELVVGAVRAHEGELSMAHQPDDGRRVHVREVSVERAVVPDGPGAYYLNPYVGCMLACTFCYASHRGSFSRSLQALPDAPWGRWVDVKSNAPEVVRREARVLPPGIVRMSPIITDPYQPIERRYRITRGCIEAMAGSALVPAVLTRSSLVVEDLPLLASFEGAALGVSVPTDDDRVRAAFEPQTESVEARIATLRAGREAGLRTFAIVQPMLPLDPARLVELLAPLVMAVNVGPLFEKPRALPIYRSLGRLEQASEGWERATFEALRQGFEARGVAVNPRGPGWAFMQ